MPGRMRGRFSPQRLAGARKERAALELRRQGATYDQIKDRLHYVTRSGAYKAVQRGLESWNPDREFNRIVEYERLNRLLAVLWPHMDRDTRKYPVNTLFLKVCDLIIKLTANCTVEFHPEQIQVRDATRAAPVRNQTAEWPESLAMREAGWTFRDIGAELNLSPGGAHKRVEADLLAWTAAPAALLRDEMIQIYDEMIAAIWPSATADPPDLKSFRQLLRIIDRRARLLDLYPRPAPKPRNRVGRHIPGDTTDYETMEAEETAQLTGEADLIADLQVDVPAPELDSPHPTRGCRPGPSQRPEASVSWPANTTVKYTEWGNGNIRITARIGGPNSAIQYHIQAPGDLYAGAPQGAAGAVFCGVPSPPF